MRSVVVTGAYGGMGRAAVKALVAQGFRVFTIDKRIDTESTENVIAIEADITSLDGVTAVFDKVKSECDSLYAIIHFAGIYMLDSLVEISEESFAKIFEVNLYAAYLINKTFMPLLSRGSRIVITTSELAPLDPLPFTGIYAVTKAALDKYAYSLCMELQLLGISVSVLRAGAVKTNMLGTSTDELERFCNNTKLYSCNAKRFRDIVNRVEARNVPPEKIGERVCRILSVRRARFAYSINRNPLLLLLNLLPKRLQLFAIKTVLKNK